MAGARHFVSTGRANGIDAAICCEPEDGRSATCPRVPCGSGGLRGAMAHGAMPFQGRNPNPVLAGFLGRLGDAEAELQGRHPAHPHLGEVHLTPTVLRAGQPAQMNVIPADATAWLDVRTIPDVDHDGVVAMVASSLQGRPGDERGATVTVIDDRPAVSTPATSPVVRALCDAHAAVTGEPARLGGVPGDGRNGPDGPHRHADRRVRPGRQVDRPPSRRVRGCHRDHRSGRGLPRGRPPLPGERRPLMAAAAAPSATVGPRNDLTDVEGCGSAAQRLGRGWRTGTTVILTPPGTVGGVDVGAEVPAPRDRCAGSVEPGPPRPRRVPHRGRRVRARGRRRRDALARGAGHRLPDRRRPGTGGAHRARAVLFDLGRGGVFRHRPDAGFGWSAAVAAGRGRRSRPVVEGTVGAMARGGRSRRRKRVGECRPPRRHHCRGARRRQRRRRCVRRRDRRSARRAAAPPDRRSPTAPAHPRRCRRGPARWRRRRR